MTPEIRTLIESLYPTGKYRDVEDRCEQLFNDQRAEAYAMRDRLVVIPGGEWKDWDPGNELERSRLLEMCAPNCGWFSEYGRKSKLERIAIIVDQYAGRYCGLFRLEISNVGPFYDWTWGCDDLVKVGRGDDIEFRFHSTPPTPFCEAVIRSVETIMADFGKTRLMSTEGPGSEVVPWLDVSGTELEAMRKPATVYDCFFNPY